jgi:hypothetical protein
MVANLGGGVSVVGDLTGASDDRDDAASGDKAKHAAVYHCCPVLSRATSVAKLALRLPFLILNVRSAIPLVMEYASSDQAPAEDRPRKPTMMERAKMARHEAYLAAKEYRKNDPRTAERKARMKAARREASAKAKELRKTDPKQIALKEQLKKDRQTANAVAKEAWIDPSVKDVRPILAKASADGLYCYPVSRAVNTVRNDPRLIERVPEPMTELPKGETLRLF